MHFRASITRNRSKLSTEIIPYLAVARFSGADAGTFLQSQLSADIESLGVDESTLACYCTPKGKVLGLLLVGREGGDFLLAGSHVLLPGILRRLKMYVLRSKVVIEEEPSRAVAGSPGPAYRFVESGENRADVEAWRAQELRAGVSWLDEGSQERFIPQMLGFEGIGAVSFKKGCYPGQEIVARARYLGKVKRKPLIVEAENAPAPETGSKVRLLRGSEWTDAVVVDQAPDGGKRVVFTVATAADTPAEQLEVDGQRYRCATI